MTSVHTYHIIYASEKKLFYVDCLFTKGVILTSNNGRMFFINNLVVGWLLSKKFLITIKLQLKQSFWPFTKDTEQPIQGTKKLISDIPGLVYFAFGLVDFILHLQVKVLSDFSFFFFFFFLRKFISFMILARIFSG